MVKWPPTSGKPAPKGLPSVDFVDYAGFSFLLAQAKQNADEKYEKPASGTFGNLEGMPCGGK